MDSTSCSPARGGIAFDRSQGMQLDAEPVVTFRPKANEDERVGHQHCHPPSITPENVNQINHLNGQFRFVDDAQRLFRPLLEAIGVNVKVRLLTTYFGSHGTYYMSLFCCNSGSPAQYTDEKVWWSLCGGRHVGLLSSRDM